MNCTLTKSIPEDEVYEIVDELTDTVLYYMALLTSELYAVEPYMYQNNKGLIDYGACILFKGMCEKIRLFPADNYIILDNYRSKLSKPKNDCYKLISLSPKDYGVYDITFVNKQLDSEAYTIEDVEVPKSLCKVYKEIMRIGRLISLSSFLGCDDKVSSIKEAIIKNTYPLDPYVQGNANRFIFNNGDGSHWFVDAYVKDDNDYPLKCPVIKLRDKDFANLSFKKNKGTVLSSLHKIDDMQYKMTVCNWDVTDIVGVLEIKELYDMLLETYIEVE